MTIRDQAELDRRRAERNQDIVDRMRAGDPLQRPASETFFPPRPLIKKDPREVARALGLPPLPGDDTAPLKRIGDQDCD